MLCRLRRGSIRIGRRVCDTFASMFNTFVAAPPATPSGAYKRAMEGRRKMLLRLAEEARARRYMRRSRPESMFSPPPPYRA